MAKNQGEGFKHRIKSLLGLRKATTIQAVGSEREEEHEFIFSTDVLKVMHCDHLFDILRHIILAAIGWL